LKTSQDIAITSQDLGLTKEQTIQLVASLSKLNESTQGLKLTPKEERARIYITDVIKGLKRSLKAE
jgi:hypothetical protein